jgi:chromatin segregation and condensation protein Rec8/ScpA/Scc1 (kleisin family)
VVVTLLAVLELVRLQRVRAQQREPFGEVVIERVADAGAAAAVPTARPGSSDES